MFGHPGSAVLEKLWTVLAEGEEGKTSFEHEVGGTSKLGHSLRGM